MATAEFSKFVGILKNKMLFLKYKSTTLCQVQHFVEENIPPALFQSKMHEAYYLCVCVCVCVCVNVLHWYSEAVGSSSQM